MKYWFGLGLSLWMGIVWAGDASQLGDVLFSPDERYVALEQYGVHDGSGEVYVSWLFIDVPKNNYAIKPTEVFVESQTDEAALLTQVRSETRHNIKELLDKINIRDTTSSSLLPVINRPFSDVGADPNLARFALGTPLAGLAYTTYAVRLAKQPADAECYGMGSAKIFTLTVENEANKAKTVLQEDKKVPKSRGCPLDYRIAYVYVDKQNQIIVLLNMFTPGFEGQDMRYLAVTGKLP